MFFITCKSVYKLPGIADSREWKTQSISPSPQILTGDPDSGFYYLTQGAYLGTGLPYAMLKKKIEKNPQKFVRKSGLASEYGYAVFKSEYGVEVMNGTCFSCHESSKHGIRWKINELECSSQIQKRHSNYRLF